MSTCFEIYYKPKEKSDIPEKIAKQSTQTTELFTAFSIIRNTQSLCAKNTRFSSLDTIRLLLIINVHISHIYQFTTSYGLLTLKKIFSEVMHKIYEDNRYVFARTPLMVDALFTLRFKIKNFCIFIIKNKIYFICSGFLLSYTLLRKLDRSRGRFNYIEFLFKRWIRFLVLVFGSILFFYLFPLFGDGPIWEEGIKLATTGCKDTTTLIKQFFFVNNYRHVLRDHLSISSQKVSQPFDYLLIDLDKKSRNK